MAFSDVKQFLENQGFSSEIHEFSDPEASATVALAAEALGTQMERIAKSMAVHAGEKTVMIVAAGDVKLNNGLFKAQFGVKPSMLKYEEVLPLIGHPVGGVCPFLVKDGCDIYLDVSLRRFETVFPACGSPNSAVEITPDRLFGISGAKAWVEVCKLPESD